MDPTKSTTAILPLDLGAAAAYDQHIFPLAYYVEGDNLTKGSLLIRATLEEMKRIKNLGIDLSKNEEFIYNTRLQVEALHAQREKLQEKHKTLNPIKALLNYRAARLFHAASKALYLDTKSTSEKIQREKQPIRVVSSKQMRTVDGVIPSDAEIRGIAIELPGGLDDDAKKTIDEAKKTITTTDPFLDNLLITQLGDDDQAITLANTESLLSLDVSQFRSSPDEGERTSAAPSDQERPQIINQFHIHNWQNSVVTTNSNLPGLTINHGSQNSGALVTQQPEAPKGPQ